MQRSCELEEISAEDYVSYDGIMRATIHVTDACNLSCSYCGFDSGAGAERDSMPLGKIREVIRAIARADVLRLDLSGGEAFVRQDIFDIIQTAVDQDMSLGILTNGTLITPETAKELSHYPVHSVKVSLDGMEEENDRNRGAGTFRKALSGLENLIAHTDIRTKVLFTLTKNNVEDAAEVAKRLSDLGVWRFVVRPCDTMGRSEGSFVPREVDIWTLYRKLLVASEGLGEGFIEWYFTNPYPHHPVWANNPYVLIEASGRHFTVLADGDVMIDYCNAGSKVGNVFTDDINGMIQTIESAIEIE